ncbi:MAG TPA: tetratricopeptide repeat protein [Verrucomicrobiae bacterium]|jgi:tetratricopeptide (TPR) repeat protein|nr:tetratricopeptide repeat protein [Verrucomicrobiae bacterium]
MLRACTLGTTIFFLFAAISFAQQAQPAQAPPPAPGSPQDFVQQAQKLSQEGDQNGALDLYRKAMKKAPDLYEAHLGAGVALDLKGDYTKARKEFEEAIKDASPDTKAQALRSMAFSYAFESQAEKAAKFEKMVFDDRIRHKEWTTAAGVANELARIYLESGDPQNAYKWYKLGYETAQRKTDMNNAEKNLWLFRWENAQARIDAREGKPGEAQQHVAAAKDALDKANNPDQLRFYPYLTGYVAYYAGNYTKAIADLLKADQHDPLILALLGEAYQKAGDEATAKKYFEKVLEINIHNPTNAFARPLAKMKLA